MEALANRVGMGNPRSAGNAWLNIRKKIEKFAHETGDGANDNGEGSSTPAPLWSTPAGGKRKASDDDDELAGGDTITPKKTPAKRARATPKKKAAIADEDGLEQPATPAKTPAKTPRKRGPAKKTPGKVNTEDEHEHEQVFIKQEQITSSKNLTFTTEQTTPIKEEPEEDDSGIKVIGGPGASQTTAEHIDHIMAKASAKAKAKAKGKSEDKDMMSGGGGPKGTRKRGASAEDEYGYGYDERAALRSISPEYEVEVDGEV